MAGGLADLDTTMPERKGNTDYQIKAVYDYLVLLLENLRYTLRNLGVENFNETSLKEYGLTITEPIQALIEDEVEGLSTRIDVNAAGIQTEVTRATGAEASLRLTAEGLRTDVNAASGAASTAQQTANAIKAQVTDAQGNYTVVNLKADGLHIGNASGTTTIDGSSITADTITGNLIKAGQTIESPTIDGGTLISQDDNTNIRIEINDGIIEYQQYNVLTQSYDVVGRLNKPTAGNLILDGVSVPLELSGPALHIGYQTMYGYLLPTIPTGQETKNRGRVFIVSPPLIIKGGNIFCRPSLERTNETTYELTILSTGTGQSYNIYVQLQDENGNNLLQSPISILFPYSDFASHTVTATLDIQNIPNAKRIYMYWTSQEFNANAIIYLCDKTGVYLYDDRLGSGWLMVADKSTTT